MAEEKFLLPKSVIEVLQAVNRLLAVEETGLIDSKTPQAFQTICSTTASVLDAPVVQITLLKEFRQYIKTSIGFDINQAPTSTSFCAYTIASDQDVTIILDTQLDPLFKRNPFVTDPPYVRFYAGCPVVFENEKVGTLCVYDFKPRESVSEEQINFLKKLALDAQAAIYGSRNQ